MRLLSIAPTVFLAALTYSGTSQQTPVKSLEPRDLSIDVQYVSQGLAALSFSLEATTSAFNALGKNPLRGTLASGFNATETLLDTILPRVQGILVITGDAAQNVVLSAESNVVTDTQNLYSALASRVKDFDYPTVTYVSITLASLKTSLLKVADNLVRTINRPEAPENRDKLITVFSDAEVTFKWHGTGGVRD